MIQISSWTNTIFFSLVGTIHVYWAFLGFLGIPLGSINAVIPEKKEGNLSFQPSVLATLVVAIGLFTMAFFSWAILSDAVVFSEQWVKRINAGIAFLFLVRAIGDFKYVGFFKKVKETRFALNDTRYYSPLCLCVAYNALIIAIN